MDSKQELTIVPTESDVPVEETTTTMAMTTRDDDARAVADDAPAHRDDEEDDEDDDGEKAPDDDDESKRESTTDPGMRITGPAGISRSEPNTDLSGLDMSKVDMGRRTDRNPRGDDAITKAPSPAESDSRKSSNDEILDHLRKNPMEMEEEFRRWRNRALNMYKTNSELHKLLEESLDKQHRMEKHIDLLEGQMVADIDPGPIQGTLAKGKEKVGQKSKKPKKKAGTLTFVTKSEGDTQRRKTLSGILEDVLEERKEVPGIAALPLHPLALGSPMPAIPLATSPTVVEVSSSVPPTKPRSSAIDAMKIDWPKFSGKPGESVVSWVRDVSHLGEVKGETPEETFLRLKILLRDAALVWFQTLPDPIKGNSQEFLRLLYREFGEKDQRAVEMRFRQCKQLKGQGVREYLRQLRLIAQDYYGCTDTTLRSQFEEGLLDQEVRRLVLMLANESLENVVDTAARAEQMTQYEKGKEDRKDGKDKILLATESPPTLPPKPRQEEPKLGECKEALSEMTQAIKAMQESVSDMAKNVRNQNPRRNPLQRDGKERTRDGKPICFNCHKPGHISRYCRQPRKDEPVEAVPEPEAKTLLVNARESYQPMTVQGYIGGMEETLTIDTGSSITLMAEQDYLRLLADF
jgi:hypothetical protein